ncbi:MAG: glycosyltransferase family 4 protein [Coriobacteriia bacterium]
MSCAASRGLERVQHIRRERLELHLVPQPRGDRLLWHQPSVRLLRETLMGIAPDIAHAHMTGPYADAVLQSPFPKIVTPHGVVSRESTLAMRYGSFSARARWWIDAKYEQWVTLRARDLIAISPYMIRECQPYTHARFHLIENPVAEAFFGVPDAVGKGATVLCVARVMPRKDILTPAGSVRSSQAGAAGSRAGDRRPDRRRSGLRPALPSQSS